MSHSVIKFKICKVLSFLEARYDPIFTGKNMVIIDDVYENCGIWDHNHSSVGGGGGGD